MAGFGSGMTAPTDTDILEKLQSLYAEKLRPLEKKSRWVSSRLHPPPRAIEW